MAQSGDRVDLGVMGGGTVQSVFGRPEARQATVLRDDGVVVTVRAGSLTAVPDVLETHAEVIARARVSASPQPHDQCIVALDRALRNERRARCEALATLAAIGTLVPR